MIHYGYEETVTCIQYVDVVGPKDESLCLAYKTSKVFVGAGLFLTNDGYVLGVEIPGTNEPSLFYKIDDEEVHRLQSLQLVPSPLPTYKIPWTEYAIGYSLWPCLVIGFCSEAPGGSRQPRRCRTPATAGVSGVDEANI